MEPLFLVIPEAFNAQEPLEAQKPRIQELSATRRGLPGCLSGLQLGGMQDEGLHWAAAKEPNLDFQNKDT